MQQAEVGRGAGRRAGRGRGAQRQFGDDHRLGELFHSHKPRLTTYVQRIVTGWHDAEEVVADALFTAWRRRHELPDDPDRAVGWLYGTARNLARNHVRSEVRRARLVDRAGHHAAEATQPGAHEVAVDRAAMLDAWVALPDADREVLALAMTGRSYAEISDRLGVAPGGVGMRLMRARARLVAPVDSA